MADVLPPEKVSALGAQLVDVRNDEEWDESRIPGARHVPFDRLQAEAGKLDADRPVVFYCRAGDRSAAAADALESAGREAYSMEGGLVAWKEAGLPLEPEGAEVAAHHQMPPD